MLPLRCQNGVEFSLLGLGEIHEGEPNAILTAKRQHPEMKIIAIGGGSRPVNRLFEEHPSGVARTFWKPFELGDLVKAVEKELNITARGLINV